METIYAIDSNSGLSKNGIIPWKSKKDMTFFMNKTKNNVVIMGKNTFFSIPEENRPLRNRLNIVLTSTPQDFSKNMNSNVLFTRDNNIYQTILQNRDKYYDNYQFLNADFKVFFIGGKTIYEQFIPLCDKIWVTYIKRDYNCDLSIDYDYSDSFSAKVYDEDDELKIVEYTRI